ncbi:hypothetical protein BSKO_07539 [Bryopsis sp. KO-2023]|nr:hypothetical protein BSKO_07539 [Bryopsis sp. KO-2023]
MNRRLRRRIEPPNSNAQETMEVDEGGNNNFGIIQDEANRDAHRRRAQAQAARRNAAHYATFTEEDDRPDNLHAGYGGENAQDLGPMGIVRSLELGRGAARTARQEKLKEDPKSLKDSSIEWDPQINRGKIAGGVRGVKSLKHITLDLLTEYIEDVSTLWGVPDSMKVELATRVCDCGGLVPEVVPLFTQGEPSEVELSNCTKLDEACLKGICETVVSPRLVRFHLSHCGRGMGELCAKVLGTTCPLTSLTELSLNKAYRLLDSGLKCILKSTTQLEYLSLQHCSRLNGDFLEGLLVHAPGLKYLDLTECRGIGGYMLKKFIPKLKHLSTLKLDGNQEVGDECLTIIASACPIRVLSIRQCCKVTDWGVVKICESSPDLVALFIDEVKSITEIGVDALARHCTKLQEFSLRHCTKIPEESLCSVVANGKMRHLNMTYLDHIKGPLMQTIASRCRHSMESLEISFCRNIPEDAVGLVADSCFNLRKINIFGLSHITNRFLNGHRNDQLTVIGVGTLNG